MVKNLPTNAGDANSIPGSERSLREGNGFTPVFLSAKFHGQRSLADYSPWDHKRVGQGSAINDNSMSLK